MITITLAVVAADAEAVLNRCISSIRTSVDEVVVLDLGSRDHTRDMARTLTPHVYDWPLEDDWSAARNHALSLATQDYILWLDPDEWFEPEDAERLRLLKDSLDPATDVVFMVDFRHDGGESLVSVARRPRLVKRDRHFQWHGVAEEDLGVGGRALLTDIRVMRRVSSAGRDRALHIFQRRWEAGRTMSVRDLLQFGRALAARGSWEAAREVYGRLLDDPRTDTVVPVIACRELARCCAELGDEEAQLPFLLRSFTYDVPRAEICCLLGQYFAQVGKSRPTEFWFGLASSLPVPAVPLGPHDEAYRTWVPHKQLAFHYCAAGRVAEARAHAEAALRWRAADEQLQHIAWLASAAMSAGAESATMSAGAESAAPPS